MKVIDPFKWPTITADELLSPRARELEYVRCPRCNRPICYEEAVVTKQMESMVEERLKELNNALNDIHLAALRLYGEDPRQAALFEQLLRIKEELLRPRLKLVEKETNKKAANKQP